MHWKVDQIASFLGIDLYYPRMEHHVEGGSGRCASGRSMGRTDNTPEERVTDAIQLSGGRRQNVGHGPGFQALP